MKKKSRAGHFIHARELEPCSKSAITQVKVLSYLKDIVERFDQLKSSAILALIKIRLD